MPTFGEVVARFGGVLEGGGHAADGGYACALEAVSVWRGIPWTDDPALVGMPDLRQLNDAIWSSRAARTAAMIPLVDALQDWPSWSASRRRVWAETVALRTVREILGQLATLPEDVRRQCAQSATVIEAAKAAAVAGDAATAAAAEAAAARAARAAEAAVASASSAAWAASSAAREVAAAAAWAAEAASAAALAAAVAEVPEAAAAEAAANQAADQVLMTACRIWIEAAEATR